MQIDQLRIALIVPDNSDYGVELAQTLGAKCRVLLCVAERYGTTGRQPLPATIDVEWIQWPRQRNPRNVSFARQLAARIRKWQPDVVHFSNEGNAWSWLVAYLLKELPKITTVHDVVFHPGDTASRRIPRAFANALIKRSEAIIVHGDGLKVEASRRLPIRAEWIFAVPLVPSFFPDQESTVSKREDGFFRLLFYGRIYKYKGLGYLLDAMPLVHTKVPNLRLTVAGRGEDITQYAARADQSYIEFRNRFVTLAESRQLFADADLLVLPYIEASQSGPLMNAMAFGLPVVATDVGELSSVVRSTEMGIVVPSRDKNTLASAIIKIAKDRELRKRFSENAIRAINTEFSREAICLKIVDIYMNVLRARKR